MLARTTPGDLARAPASGRLAAPAHVEIIRDMEDAAAVWRGFEQDAAMTVFQSHAWLAAWWQCVGTRRSAQPVICVVRQENGRPGMILPLALERRFGLPSLVWMAECEADYHAPLLDRDFAARCDHAMVAATMTAIADSVPEARMIALCKTATRVGDLANPLAMLAHRPHPAAAHAISLAGTWEDFYAAKRSKSTRRRDRQRLRRLEDMGDLRFEIAQDAPARHSLLEAILAQKAGWFAARGIADPFAAPEVRAFLHRLIDTPALSDVLHISAMTLDGEVVAGNFGYVHKGRFYAVIGSVTGGPAGRHSPGVFHLHALMRWCMAHGIGVLDLTVGDEGYKKEWCDTTLNLVDIHLPLSFGGTLAMAGAQTLAGAKRWIKQSPRLFDAAQAVRRRVRGMGRA